MTLILKAVKRETAATTRDGGKVRPIVIEWHPGDPCLWLRQKGTRRRYALPYESAYLQAVKLSVEAARREKAKARKEGRNR